MHVLKHPALTSVYADALQSRVDRVASWNIPHPRMAKAGVAGLEFGNQLVDFFLEPLRFGVSKNLIPPAPSQSVPIHSIHAWIEMLGLYQSADFVENLRAFVESQIHCCLMPIGVEVSPTAMNAAQ